MYVSNMQDHEWIKTMINTSSGIIVKVVGASIWPHDITIDSNGPCDHILKVGLHVFYSCKNLVALTKFEVNLTK